MKYKFSLIMMVLFCTTSTVAQIQKSKVISRSYPITNNTEIQIENKYGNIQVVNWDKDSVKFEIDISVTGRKYQKMIKAFVDIDVEFRATNYYIIARTVFRNEKNRLWTDVVDLTNSILKGGNKTEINYTVYMPAGNTLNLKNKFGNIYLNDREADSKIILSNGDLKANKFNGFLDLDFSYGMATIREMNKARVRSNYGEINFHKTGDLTLNSKSSTISIDYLNTMNINSRRDKLYLGELGSINGELSLSFLRVENLIHDLGLKSGFGDIIVTQVEKSFNHLSINSSNTDISLAFNQGSSFTIDIYYTKKTALNIPGYFKNQREIVTGGDDEETRLTALAGDNPETKTLVKINQKSGSIDLIQK